MQTFVLDPSFVPARTLGFSDWAGAGCSAAAGDTAEAGGDGKVRVMRNNAAFGKCVYIRYKGGVLGEEPFDDRSQGEPVKIILGAGSVIPGIEDVLSEMAEGEERTVVIPPEEAYGTHDPDGVQTYPRTMFSFGTQLEAGDAFQWTNPASGMPIPVRVIDATRDAVTVDFNHPLAEKTLEYWLRVDRLVD